MWGRVRVEGMIPNDSYIVVRREFPIYHPHGPYVWLRISLRCAGALSRASRPEPSPNWTSSDPHLNWRYDHLLMDYNERGSDWQTTRDCRWGVSSGFCRSVIFP